MKKVTSTTIWNDSAGRRLSVTYSEVDEVTHRVIKDNIRENFIITNESEILKTNEVIDLAQTIVDAQ